MDARSLRMPLLRMNEKHILLIDSRYWLRLSGGFFEEGCFGIPTYFIDSNLQEYEILDVSKKRLSYHVMAILGWPWRKWWFVAEYKLGEPIQLSFDEVKTKVIDLVVRNRWYAQGGESRKQFVEAFESFASMEELMANISAYGDPPF